MKTTSIRSRMRILILALLVAVGLGSIVSFKILATGNVNKSVALNATDTSRLVDRMLRLQQNYTLGRVKTLASAPTLRSQFRIKQVTTDVKQGISNPTMQSNFDRFVGDVQVESLALMDDRGNILAASPLWPKAMPHLVDLPNVTDVFDGQTWEGLTAQGGVLYSIVIAPVKVSDQGLYAGLIGVKRITGDAAKGFLFNESSQVVFMVDDQPLAATENFHGALHATSEQVQQIVGDDGHDYVGMYRQLHDTRSGQNLGFIAFEDLGELTSFSRTAGAYFVVILLTMTVIGLLLGERFMSSLTKPLDDVVRAARDMRGGQSPLPFDVRNRRDEVGELQRVFNDMVSAVEENQKLLLGMIDSDPLTGLGNHRAFQERLRLEVTRARQADMPLSLLLLDLDNFHEYNAVHTHSDGDMQLKAYAGVIRAVCPGNAILARYSGDQFVAMLPGLGAEEAREVAGNIRKAASQDNELIPISIGIAPMDPNSPNEEAITLAAELALSRAKQLGRNRISMFDSHLESETPGSSQLIQKYLIDGSLATVQALAAAVDAKDRYTQGHSERVANLARDLAEYMKNSPTFIELVYRAGTLHDVGKIGVPDAILSKPDRLTDDEMSVMETHPVMGEVIVAKVPQLAALLPGVRHHHERWDGRGYPDGLAGEQIPIMARYLAVADTFDAMTSDRPYRSALAVDVALAEIEKCAGTQFQAELAVAFVKMVREMRSLKAIA